MLLHFASTGIFSHGHLRGQYDPNMNFEKAGLAQSHYTPTVSQVPLTSKHKHKYTIADTYSYGDPVNKKLVTPLTLMGIVWVFLKWSCVRYFSVASVLRTVDGGRYAPSLEKQTNPISRQSV